MKDGTSLIDDFIIKAMDKTGGKCKKCPYKNVRGYNNTNLARSTPRATSDHTVL